MGLGISAVLGLAVKLTLWSGCGGGPRTLKRRIEPTAGSLVPARACATVTICAGSRSVLVHLQIDHVHGLTGTVAGEINDDVIPLCDAKLVRLRQRNGDRQQVAVIRYLNELRAIAQCQNKEA